VERVEVVAASLAEAQLLALTPAQAQAELSERLVPERGFRLLGAGKREGPSPVRLTLEVDAVQEQSNASGLPGLEEVTASLGIRRNTDDGVERIVLQATRGQPVEGDALDGRQEAARRALDQVLDRLVQEARVHLDARRRDDARLTRDLHASDPLVRDAATLALVARRNRAAIPALVERLKGEGKDVDIYLSGRKGEAYYRFRQRPIVQAWTGFSDQPSYDVARDIGKSLIEAFLAEEGDEAVDEVHVVYTRFRSMLVQEPTAVRLLPLEIVEGEERPAPDEVLPLYEFEPSVE